MYSLQQTPFISAFAPGVRILYEHFEYFFGLFNKKPDKSWFVYETEIVKQNFCCKYACPGYVLPCAQVFMRFVSLGNIIWVIIH